MGMRVEWRSLTPIILAFIVAAAGSANFVGGMDPTYLTFTVRDRAGFYVRDLSPSDVAITLDGKPVDVRLLTKRVDSDFVVVLENSPRVAREPISLPQLGRINPIDWFRFQMEEEFFQILTSQGNVQLAEFFDEYKVLQDFTDEEGMLLSALREMVLNFTGIVFDNIRIGRVLGRAVDFLQTRTAKRKTIVLFTKTVDRESQQNIEEYRQLLRYSGIDLYAVSFAPQFVSSTSSSFEEKVNASFFRALASETSGKAYLTGEYTYIDELFTDLKGRLDATWVAGFYVSPVGKEEHDVKVNVALPKAQVTHRKKLVF